MLTNKLKKKRNMNVLKICIVDIHTALTHTLTPADMTPGAISKSLNPDEIQDRVQYYIEPLLHGTPYC
jgi:hypothetical protein